MQKKKKKAGAGSGGPDSAADQPRINEAIALLGSSATDAMWVKLDGSGLGSKHVKKVSWEGCTGYVRPVRCVVCTLRTGGVVALMGVGCRRSLLPEGVTLSSTPPHAPRQLCAALERSSSTLSLNLSGNNLGDEGGLLAWLRVAWMGLEGGMHVWLGDPASV